MKPTKTDRLLADVILMAHRRGFTVQSDFARTHADGVAMASSMGLISTRLYGTVFSREWRPTPKGLDWLYEVMDILIEDEDADTNEGHDD